MKQIEPITMNYIGTSMNPTLKPGDKLEIIPYHGQGIRRGDVIALIPPGGDYKVIHRVVFIGSHGIRTRGDNSNQVDEWTLNPEHIIGRVVSAKRGNQRRRIFRGREGQCFALTGRALQALDSIVSSLLRPSYHRLAVTGIFRHWLPTWVKPRVITLNRPTGTELQLLMGRRVVGRWLPGMPRWHIRRPYRLFVDETSLPENSFE